MKMVKHSSKFTLTNVHGKSSDHEYSEIKNNVMFFMFTVSVYPKERL